MVFAPVLFGGIKPGALLTGWVSGTASSEITNRVATAVRIKLLAASAKVRAGRVKFSMAGIGFLGSALVEQPRDERRGGRRLAGIYWDDPLGVVA
jgi:hypothetical protein